MATVNYPFSGLFKSRPFAHVGPQADRHREELLRWWRAFSPPPPQQFLSASAEGARKDNETRLLNSPGKVGSPGCMNSLLARDLKPSVSSGVVRLGRMTLLEAEREAPLVALFRKR